MTNPHQPRILIVDDEMDFAEGIARHVQATLPNCLTATAFSGLEGLVAIDTFTPDIVLLDLVMPGMDGHQVLHEALKKQPNLSIIILTAHGTVETAVSAIKSGAWDFLTKPISTEDLIRSLNKALERTRLLGENKRLTELMSYSEIHRTIIGDSTPMRRLKESITAVANTNYTVLIQGESGTGKELVAESVHQLSDRRNNNFLRVNCPAIPEQLLESELFGHVKGAFTGATATRKGIFIEASGGTLLLDEIGDIPLNIQIKLLRVLQDGEIRPVGGAKTIYADTRVIAVTNQDLEAKIKEGSFREDLYYRLKVLTLFSPPLRERRDDIPLLAAHFLRCTCKELGVEEKSFSPELMAILCQYHWHGNVRELQNTVRRMAVFCTGPILEKTHLQTDIIETVTSPQNTAIIGSYKESKQMLIESFTHEYVDQLLKKTAGNISEAARLSGLERVSLQKIIKRLAIDASAYKN